MKLNLSKIAAFGVAFLGLSSQAHAWNGPICYLDTDQQFTITLETYAGEKPGDLQVKFDDNEGELELVSVRPSTTKPDSHEIVLHHPEGRSGIVGVKFYSLLAQGWRGPTYEFEFREGMNCSGAIIESKMTKGSALSEALDDFNQRVQQSKPWGAYTVTEAMVKQAIIEQMNDISAEYRDDYRVILGGRMPESARLVYHSVEGKYFFVRLEISHGSHGYGLRVGKDVHQ